MISPDGMDIPLSFSLFWSPDYLRIFNLKALPAYPPEARRDELIRSLINKAIVQEPRFSSNVEGFWERNLTAGRITMLIGGRKKFAQVFTFTNDMVEDSFTRPLIEKMMRNSIHRAIYRLMTDARLEGPKGFLPE